MKNKVVITTDGELDSLPDDTVVLSEVTPGSPEMFCRTSARAGGGWWSCHVDEGGVVELVRPAHPALPALLLVDGGRG